MKLIFKYLTRIDFVVRVSCSEVEGQAVECFNARFVSISNLFLDITTLSEQANSFTFNEITHLFVYSLCMNEVGKSYVCVLEKNRMHVEMILRLLRKLI